MRKVFRFVAMCAFLGAIVATEKIVQAHGFVGDRFFPPTIATDDPFATDELSLPSVSYFDSPNPLTHTTDIGAEFDKEIFPQFAVGIADDYLEMAQSGDDTIRGWNNIQLSAKYQLWQNDPHEAIISAGLLTNIGGTGGTNTSDRFSTFIPTFYWGKGFGDLPDSLEALQPIALTGTLDNTFPTSANNPNVFDYGMAVEYSLPYLQQHVVDIGLPEPLKNMIPLVEFAFTTGENHGLQGQTTGTINPGVLYETPYCQIGAEAVIPANSATGPHVGVIVNLQIFIDDLFPKLFGHPLFGEQN
jgi:hypothetical protein